jgi:hypothetical protein
MPISNFGLGLEEHPSKIRHLIPWLWASAILAFRAPEERIGLVPAEMWVFGRCVTHHSGSTATRNNNSPSFKTCRCSFTPV